MIRALYIDREPNEYVQPMSSIRIWKHVALKQEPVSPWKKTDPWEQFQVPAFYFSPYMVIIDT